MNKKNKNKQPTEIKLPKDILARINLGQSFAEYDKILSQPGVFVTTPAIQAALEPSRSKCFFVGRRGTGKTAITLHLALKRHNTIQVHPQVFTALNSCLEIDELRDPRQRPFHSLVACFKRAILDEVLAERIERKQLDFSKFPGTLTPERNFIEDYDFDLRTLAFVETIFDDLHSNKDKDWLRQMNKAKQVAKDVDGLADGPASEFIVLIDRIDDTWDGSDKAVVVLMALMHACVELSAAVKSVRPLLFLRENIYERVRAIDPEFTRIETCVVSLDWTKELLLELVERRLQLPLNPKPPIGKTWDYLFERMAGSSSYEMIFDFCQHRPRDVLTYTSFAVETAQSSKHEKVTVEDLRSAQRKFSESRLKDLGDEYAENYPQLQVVLNSFHGLATEFTVPAVSAFIQKLLSDGELMKYCGSWLSKVTPPNLFINLMYSIGFVGIRNGADLHFRGVGTRSASPPPVSSKSTIVVHPSYVLALDLQNKVLGDLDDITLQKDGLLLDLPEAIDLAEYRNKLTQLLADIDTVPHGNDADQQYEAIVGDVVKLCFFHALTNVEQHVRDIDGRVIRDWIASNVAETGFWQLVRDRYNATQVIWECKNYADLAAGDFHQTAYYMDNAIGTFAVMCFRGEVKKHYYQHIRRIKEKGGMVLLLTDKDLKVFIRQSLNQKVKETHIRDLYDTTVRLVS